MNRIRIAWRSLGAVRQMVAIAVVLLALVQVGVFVALGLSAFLPIVALLLGILGLILKDSANVRRSVSAMDEGERVLASVRTAINDQQVALARLEELLAQTSRDIRRSSRRLENGFDSANEGVREALSALNDGVSRTQRTIEECSQKHDQSAVLIESQQAHTDDMIHGAVAAVATSIGEAQKQLSEKISPIEAKVTRAFDGGHSQSLERRIIAEISAMTVMPSPAGSGLPPIEGWAMAPLAIHLMSSIAERLGPESTVLELGSGVSTAWVAFVLAELPNPPALIAIDHDSTYAEKTREFLRNLRKPTRARVIHAPLQSLVLNDETFTWYGTEWISEVREIGLLVVDGPPAGKDPSARYPALPLLLERLVDGATIIVDDAARPGETESVERWLDIPGVHRVGFVGRSLILKYSRVSSHGA